ncbi:hypothetical protein MSAR_40990 [Mycolicibacterium sarraceniae]|uniref:Uncharacterized protein n=1 Tax=Mycolicibacterium sarraceniae TaxID=1534348 RepID=A0A7I7SW66_9MYCO|nr:hypothetical protein MSAR_40990 [Mycolicibacterium sarraceniae]
MFELAHVVVPKLSFAPTFDGGQVKQPLICDAWTASIGGDERRVGEQYAYGQGEVASVIETLETQRQSVAFPDMPTLVAEADDVADLKIDHAAITVFQDSGRVRSACIAPLHTKW